MADPQSYFGIAPPQPNTAFFNANSGRRNVGGLKALLGEQQRFQEYDVNRGQNAQQLREQEFYRLADEQAQIVMPMIQQLDYRDPDYNVKRQEIERQAPLAGLSKSVRDLFNEKDARYYNEVQRADYQKRGELTPADLAGNGVEQSVIETLMTNGKLDQVAANRAIFQQKNAPKPEVHSRSKLVAAGISPDEIDAHTNNGVIDSRWVETKIYESAIQPPPVDKDLTYEELLKSGIPPHLAQQAYDSEAGVWVPSKAAEIVGQWKRKQLQAESGLTPSEERAQEREITDALKDQIKMIEEDEDYDRLPEGGPKRAPIEKRLKELRAELNTHLRGVSDRASGKSKKGGQDKKSTEDTPLTQEEIKKKLLLELDLIEPD